MGSLHVPVDEKHHSPPLQSESLAHGAALVQQCTPPGFDQVTQWAHKTSGLQNDLVDSDLNIFQAVENLKIITEAIPDSVSKDLKRELRALLMMDIEILEMLPGEAKIERIRQKMDLVKQLSLYTELQPILKMYDELNGKAAGLKKTEREQEYELEQITKLYQPYADKYKAHVELQGELEQIDASLLKFD